jgi:hypothetical protein
VTAFTALFDACVLYPNVLRHLLMHLALTDLFRARWSASIQEEWVRNVLEDYPDIPPSRLNRTCKLMNENVRDALITGYEGLIEALVLPDLNDRHVFAAAIKAQAGVIVTFNLKDFPVQALKPYGIAAQHPDDFITNLIDLDPFTVCTAIRAYRQSLKNPPKSPVEILEILEKQGLVTTAGELRRMLSFL